MYIFLAYYNSSPDNYSIYTLYDFEIYENGNLLKKYIPCYRKSDDVIGLYEVVNGEFKTNAGTGVFTKGPDVNLGE